MKNNLKILALLICTSMTSLPLLGSEQKEQPEKPFIVRAAKATVTGAATTAGAGVGGYLGYMAVVSANPLTSPYIYFCYNPVTGTMMGSLLLGSAVYDYMTQPESKTNEK